MTTHSTPAAGSKEATRPPHPRTTQPSERGDTDMHAMTEAQARAEGLTILPGELAAASTVVDRLTTASLTADALAAVVEALLSAGRVRRSDLLELSAGLGALHVELDELADERRQLDAAESTAQMLTLVRETHDAIERRAREGVA